MSFQNAQTHKLLLLLLLLPQSRQPDDKRQSLDELSQARGRRRTWADSSDDSVHQSEDTFSVSESQSFLFLCVCVFKLLVETNMLAHLRKADKVVCLC